MHGGSVGLGAFARGRVAAHHRRPPARRHRGQGLHAEAPDINAVFCSADKLAPSVLTEALVRGIAVPGRLAVVGFGDVDFAQTVSPSLAIVRIDGMRMGQTAPN